MQYVTLMHGRNMELQHCLDGITGVTDVLCGLLL